MKQRLVHVSAYDYDSLAGKINDEIVEYNADGFLLQDIQYFHMETDTSGCNALLLFKEVKQYLKELCHGKEVDTKGD